MSDLFHSDIPDEFIFSVFDTMVRADWHIYQILTKRPQRLARLASKLPWPEHIWAGVSVESNEVVWRADFLRRVPSAVRFISAEPLLGPIDQLQTGWHPLADHRWRKRRTTSEMRSDWVRGARDQCKSADVLYFHKQWGGRTSKSGGRELDGRTWDEMPSVGAARQLTFTAAV